MAIFNFGMARKAQDMKNFYPMSLLETGSWDILFFWVARMIMLGLKLTGDVPFREVFCHSLVRDAQGRKMSKSLGNVVDPLDVISGIPLQGLHDKLWYGNLAQAEIEKAKEGQRLSFPNGIPECGTDALRFALCAYTTGGRDINLDILRVEGYRKFCNKIYQATKFALMRLGADYKPSSNASITGKESLVEKWILHRLSAAAKIANESLEERNFFEATNAIYTFWLNELCDVYIENSKFFFTEGTQNNTAISTRYFVYLFGWGHELIHPFMPFITEELWQRFPRREGDETVTITKAAYPQFDEAAHDVKSETAYNLVLDIVKGARSLLAQYNILKGATVIVQATDEVTYQTVVEQNDSILSLVKAAEELDIVAPKDSIAGAPAGSVVSVVSPTCSVYVIVKGHVDFDAEIKKAQEKISKAENSKVQLEKLISGKDYDAKVRQDVKEANLKRLENFEAEIAGLKQVVGTFERLKL